MTKRLIVVSGAGISVESGIRAFRTDTASGKALWGGSTEDDQYDIEEVCNLESFDAGFRLKRDKVGPYWGVSESGYNCYDLTHEFYNKRRKELGTVQPNIAHLRIAEWYKKYPNQVKNLTTNVDDLFERAGIPREDVIHVHGYLREMRYKEENFGSPEKLVDVGFEEFDQNKYFWAKPNVTFFCESAPWYQGQITLFDTLTANDLVVVAGCSNQVINFNWELFPSLNIGTRMVVINPEINHFEETAYEERGVLVYRKGAGEVFSDPDFIEIVENHLEG